MLTDIFERYESNVRSYSRGMGAVLNRAVGSEVWDIDGNRYLDFLSGAGSLNYGHNHPILKEALLEYVSQDQITHSLDLYTVAKANFIDTFQKQILHPRGLDYRMQFTSPNGTNAVEAALKIARKVTGRTNILTFTNGFHGASMGAMAVTGNRYMRAANGVPLSHASVAPFDGYHGANVDTIPMIEKMLDDPSGGIDMPAAAIIEVLQGEGGLNKADAEWLRRLEKVLRSRDILLIVDDIQAGCGRAGRFFSFEEAGIKPDIVTLSKSLSGYGIPLAVVLVRDVLDQWRPGEHNGTFRGHNLAFITAKAAIDYFWSDGVAFEVKVRNHGAHMGRRLEDISAEHGEFISGVRGDGFMRGLVFRDHNVAKAVALEAYRRGLMIERAGPYDEVVKCMPPLTTPVDQLEEGLDALHQAVNHVIGDSRSVLNPNRQTSVLKEPAE